MLEQGEDGTFTQSLLFTPSIIAMSLLISENEEMMVIGMIINIEIYQKSGDTYQLNQTLNQGGPVVSSALS